jgi:hypothetical protein
MMPKGWKRVGNTAMRFKDYVMQMLAQDANSLIRNSGGFGGVVASCERALEFYKQVTLSLKYLTAARGLFNSNKLWVAFS